MTIENQIQLTTESLDAIADRFDERLAQAVALAVSNEFERIKITLEDRFAELSASQANAILSLEERVETLSSQNNKLKNKIFSLEDDAFEMHERVEDQEQRARRFNVRVENIPYSKLPRDETDDDLSAIITTELAALDINISASEIVRCHRTSRPRLVEGKTYAQAIIRVATWSARTKLNAVNRLARQAERSVRVHHDLTRERKDRLKYARDRIERAMSSKFTKEQRKHIGDEDKCFAFATLNCETICRLQGSTYIFKSLDEFDDIFGQNFSR